MTFGDLIYGNMKKIPTKNGLKRYINFDNAASTPPFKSVISTVLEAAEWYSNVHRGSGYKSKLMTEKYETAREAVAQFVGADLRHDVVIFTKNTTDSINKVNHYLPHLPGEMVVYTKMEHHSNELPWVKCRSYCVELRDGKIDLGQFDDILLRERSKIKLVAVTGASNVTGYVPPVNELAVLAHRVGAKILVDAAQLIAHRPVRVYSPDDPRHLDFLAFSGHKMYAPFGAGVLIGPRSVFAKGPPSQVGGGTIKGYGLSGPIWIDPPEVEEAGTPNILGVLALAESCRVLDKIGWESLIRHEQELTSLTLKGLREIPGTLVYNHDLHHRVGIVSFNMAGISHPEVAQFLGEYGGIGVRNGCFCARGYVQSLLGLSLVGIRKAQTRLAAGLPQVLPGMVRVSFGCYNHPSEVKVLLDTLRELIKQKSKQ